MGAWRFLSLTVLTCGLSLAGCHSASRQSFVAPKPDVKPLVVRTFEKPEKPEPAFVDARSAAGAKPQAAKVIDDKPADPNAWIAAMKKVHANFTGTPGYVALLGDSITVCDAFWTPLEFTDPVFYLTEDGLPKQPGDKEWKDVIKGMRGKGADHCNGSGWQVNYVLRAIDAMMAREKPEAAILMLGTNDIGGGSVAPGWQEHYEKIVRKCLDANCVPILNTIPPRQGREPAVEEANRIVRAVAKKYSVPLVDYHAEIVRRRPAPTYFGTLISKDGVHPTTGKTNDFSDNNLSDSGYALRTFMNFKAYRELYFRVLDPEYAEVAKK